MQIIIANSSDVPIYKQIVNQIIGEIVSGSLRSGECLPSIRALAKELKISVITTKKAYEELEKTGYIVTVAGKGCFVAPQNEDMLRENRLKQVEELLLQAHDTAGLYGITRAEVLELLSIIYEEA